MEPTIQGATHVFASHFVIPQSFPYYWASLWVPDNRGTATHLLEKSGQENYYWSEHLKQSTWKIPTESAKMPWTDMAKLLRLRRARCEWMPVTALSCYRTCHGMRAFEIIVFSSWHMRSVFEYTPHQCNARWLVAMLCDIWKLYRVDVPWAMTTLAIYWLIKLLYWRIYRPSVTAFGMKQTLETLKECPFRILEPALQRDHRDRTDKYTL